MKLMTLTFAAAMLFACNSNDKTTTDTKVAGANDSKPKTDEWIVVDSATGEKNWQAYMTPGEPHAMLAKANGEWVGDMTMWMADGAPPMKSTTSATNKMVMDGRYQMSTFTGDFMGMPFNGMGTVAYDNAKKVFISTWIDNMGTGLMSMEGPWDEATKTINFKGRMICPANGQECDVRETFQIVDDNTQLMTMYGPDQKTGKEYKNMEIKFTRKK